MSKNKKPLKKTTVQTKKIVSEKKSFASYKKWIEFFVILTVVFITYGNSIKNDYNIDDGYIVSIDEGNKLTKKGISAIPEILSSNYSTGLGVTYGYRPFAKVTMAIEYSLWENNPQYSHIINLLLYAINCFLLLIFFKKIATLFKFENQILIYLSLFLFIIHPIHTEVVCSIKNREEILCFIFSLLSIHVYFKFSETQKWQYIPLLLMLVLLAFLSKQTAINIFSAILLIIIFKEWILKNEHFKTEENVNNNKFSLANYKFSPPIKILLIILFIILSISAIASLPVIGILFFLIGLHFLLRESKLQIIQRFTIVFSIRNIIILVSLYYIYKLVMNYIPMALPEGDIGVQFESNPYFFMPASHSIPNSVQTIIFYIKKLFFPFPLLYYYGYNMLPDHGWNTIYPYIGIIGFAVVAYWVYFNLKRKQHLFIVFWMLLFWMTIFPFSNLFKSFLITGIVGERLVYQSSAAFCLLLVYLIYFFSEKMNNHFFKDKNLQKKMVYLTVIIISIPFFILTTNRNTNWLNKQTLYEHDIKYLSNSARANHIFAGNIMSRVGKPDDRNQIYKQEEIQSAKMYFQKALKIYPKLNSSWLGLGNIYAAYLSMPDSAICCYLQVDTTSKYTYVRARELIGSIYYNDSSLNKALEYYNEAFKLYPENLPLYRDMINILLQTNQFEEVIKLSDIGIKNKWPESYANKGDGYLNIRDTIQAINYYEKALQNGFINDALTKNLDYYYKSKK